MPEWTAHAWERAAQRFPGEDIELLYARARRAGRKTRQKIKAACPEAAKKYMTGIFAGRYYTITPCRVVFVMQAPETVVTAFRLVAAQQQK